MGVLFGQCDKDLAKLLKKKPPHADIQLEYIEQANYSMTVRAEFHSMFPNKKTRPMYHLGTTSVLISLKHIIIQKSIEYVFNIVYMN
jgi:hypothetical protein